jgi:hypothetical protein
MNQNPEQAAVQDLLQSSELTARLLRRLTDMPGIMDTAMVRRVMARLAGSVTRSPTLFDDLTARYRIDDGSNAGIDPLVMEQPWIMNISAYLANENSFSSTVNQYITEMAAAKTIEAAGTSSTSRPDMSGELHSTFVASHAKTRDSIPLATSSDSRYPDDRIKLSEEATPLSSTGRFRVSRNPPRRAWDAGPAYAQNVVPGQIFSSERPSTSTAPEEPNKRSERIGLLKAAGEEIDQKKAIASTVPSRSNLPLARTQIDQPEIQRRLRGEGGSDFQRNLTAYAIQGEQPPSSGEPPAKALGESSDPGSVNAVAMAVNGDLLLARAKFAGTDNQSTFQDEAQTILPQRSRAYAIREKRRPAQVEPLDMSANSSFGRGAPSAEIEITTNTSPKDLPLIRKHIESSQTPRQPPNFVWRKGTDPSSMINPGLFASGGSPVRPADQAAGSTSTNQSPHGQNIMSEGNGRRVEVRAGSAVPTERILRNISRKLLIERERRGY